MHDRVGALRRFNAFQAHLESQGFTGQLSAETLALRDALTSPPLDSADQVAAVTTPPSLRDDHASSVMREGRNFKRRSRYTQGTDSDKLRPRAPWCVRARLRDWFCAGVMCIVVAVSQLALTPVSRLLIQVRCGSEAERDPPERSQEHVADHYPTEGR